MLYNSFGGPVYELFSSSEIDIINNIKEPDCCKTCRLQKRSIPYLSTLFFIGLIFPVLFFVIWSIKVYVLIVDYFEFKDIKIPNKIESNDELDIISENFKINKNIIEENPFSDDNQIDSKTKNSQYDWDYHCKVNRKVNVWCGRSIIAFLCQIAIAAVIACAVSFSKK